MDAKEYLTERGYQFTEIDVGRDREAYDEMRELSDQTYVPTLVAGEEVLANFDTDQLEKFLNEHRIEP
jgi:glutaredoxin